MFLGTKYNFFRLTKYKEVEGSEFVATSRKTPNSEGKKRRH